MLIDHEMGYVISTPTKTASHSLESVAKKSEHIGIYRPRHSILPVDGYDHYIMHRNGYERLLSEWCELSWPKAAAGREYKEAAAPNTFAGFVRWWLTRRGQDFDIEDYWLPTCEEMVEAMDAKPITLDEVRALNPGQWGTEWPRNQARGFHLPPVGEFWTGSMIAAVMHLFKDPPPSNPTGSMANAGTYMELRYPA